MKKGEGDAQNKKTLVRQGDLIAVLKSHGILFSNMSLNATQIQHNAKFCRL